MDFSRPITDNFLLLMDVTNKIMDNYLQIILLLFSLFLLLLRLLLFIVK